MNKDSFSRFSVWVFLSCLSLLLPYGGWIWGKDLCATISVNPDVGWSLESLSPPCFSPLSFLESVLGVIGECADNEISWDREELPRTVHPIPLSPFPEIGKKSPKQLGFVPVSPRKQYVLQSFIQWITFFPEACNPEQTAFWSLSWAAQVGHTHLRLHPP